MVDQKKLEGEIEEMVRGFIADDPTLFLVDVVLKGNFGNQRLVVSLDGDNGVSIETCVSVSRQLSAVLEEKDLIDGKYHLEVTSVGVDQPLTNLRQYQKNVGRNLQVRLASGTQIEGKLDKVDEKCIHILIKEKKKEKVQEIDFEEIESSKVLVSFK